MVLATLFSQPPSAVTITQPSPMTSFDWSDFPLVHQFNPDDDTDICGTNFGDSSLVFEPAAATSSFKPLYNNESFSSCPSLTTSSSSSLSSSFSSMSSDVTSDVTSDTHDDEVSLSPCRRRHVSFAPRVEVREYEIVLGDHPSCNGLALSLGWNYSTTTTQYQDYCCANSPRRRSSQLRLTYYERKRRLVTVGGYKEEDLLMQCHKSHLRHVPTSTQLVLESR